MFQLLAIALLIGHFALLILLCVYGAHRLQLTWVAWRSRPAQPLQRLKDLPVVTVQLPLFNERFVVERLIDAVAALDYPRDRLQIQVLDDSTDDTTSSGGIPRRLAKFGAQGI